MVAATVTLVYCFILFCLSKCSGMLARLMQQTLISQQAQRKLLMILFYKQAITITKKLHTANSCAMKHN